MDIFDTWYYDTMIFIAGMYGSNDQAAQIAIMNIASLFYRVATGLCISGSTMVGNAIGSGDVILAKKKCRIVQLNGLLSIAVVTIVTFLTSLKILALLTNL